MPFDGVRYLRCEACGEFVMEGEAQAHEQGCQGDNSAFLGCLAGTIKFGPGWDEPVWPTE